MDRVAARRRSWSQNDPRIPEEVSYKAGYVNPRAPPRWLQFGAAVGYCDRGHAGARRRIGAGRSGVDQAIVPDRRQRRLSSMMTAARCAEDSTGASHGLARTHTIPCRWHFDSTAHAAVLRVGQRTDRVWHFWSPSPRAALPPGKLEGCTVRARVRISAGALLQIGMDYWLSHDGPLRPRRKQPRSRRQQLVFSFSRCGRKSLSPMSAARSSRKVTEAGRGRGTPVLQHTLLE